MLQASWARIETNESGSLANAITVDPSATVNVLRRLPPATRLELQLGGVDLLAPELVDLGPRDMSAERAIEAVDDLVISPVQRGPRVGVPRHDS